MAVPVAALADWLQVGRRLPLSGELPYRLELLLDGANSWLQVDSTLRGLRVDLPEPFGFMVNYYNQKSDIEITNLKLGVNGGELIDASNLIRIPKARTEAAALALRPNLMVLPFLTAYVVYAVGDTQTDVNVQVGDSTSFDTVAKSGAQVVSVGGTLQGGYKGFFGVADFNASVSDVDRLADTVGGNMLSFRLGYNHKLNPQGRSIALWAGTAGQLPEILDGDAPHALRGCDAQAWGATEALRVWKLLQAGGDSKPAL